MGCPAAQCSSGVHNVERRWRNNFRVATVRVGIRLAVLKTTIEVNRGNELVVHLSERS